MSASFDTSKKHAPNSLGAVLILGLGKSGAATAQYCAALLGSRVSELVIAAGEATEKSRAAAAEFEAKALPCFSTRIALKAHSMYASLAGHFREFRLLSCGSGGFGGGYQRS